MDNSILPKKQSSRFAILLGGLIIAVALFVVAVPAPAAQYFRYFSIVFPNTSFTGVFGINRTGEIVGTASGQGFLLKDGKFTTFSVPGSCTGASGINASGQIVGGYDGNSCALNTQGYLYSQGVFTTINVPGALATQPNGINDSGTIVGQYIDEASNSGKGFIYSGGIFTTLNFPGAPFTAARGINNSGLVVGLYIDSDNTNHAFTYSGGVYQNLVGLGCSNSEAYGLNNNGLIVGGCNSDTKAFVYDYSTQSTTVFNYPGAYAVPFGINDSGRVVGYYVLGFDMYNGFLAVPLQ